jgi:predicted nucleic acid-binding protein
MALVIDSSAIIALAMSDEDASYANAVLRELASESGHAPTLFWYEVRNVLIVNERRGRITASQSNLFLSDLSSLPIRLDAFPVESSVLALARRQGLSIYDAGYLELAIRHGAKLATLDSKLKNAAIAEGVVVLEP